jgi:hypothetical protein
MTPVLDRAKADVALTPQALNNGNATGRYYRLGGDYGRRIAFLALGGAAAASATTKLEVLQAQDETGTGSKVFSNPAAEKTVTSPTKVVEGTIALGSAAATDVVTVNGVDFTMVSSDPGAQEFTDAAGLASAINENIDGVVASDSSTTVTVRSEDGKADVSLGKTENSGTITLATTAHQVYVEVSEEDLDLANGFAWVAPKVTYSGNGHAAVAAIRMDGRFGAEQIGVGLIY